ncbi:MAG: hypothetical protein WAT79_13650 [Saprospiraceae bacterium]
MKDHKYFILTACLMFCFISIHAQKKSFDEKYALEQVISNSDRNRSFIVIKVDNVIVDTLLETYNTISSNWKGFESYYIASENEVAIINGGIYRRMKKNVAGFWRSEDLFQLMYCRWNDGIIRDGLIYCCTKWKLEGLQEIYRSDMANCYMEPQWIKMEFNNERQKVQHLKGGTFENNEWFKGIQKQIVQDSINRAKN